MDKKEVNVGVQQEVQQGINLSGLLEALMKEASKPVLTEAEIAEKATIEAEIVSLTNRLNMLKTRYAEIVKKETEGQRSINKALTQLANLAKNFGLDPAQFGLTQTPSTITQVKSSTKAKMSSIEVFTWDKKTSTWKPHSANSLSEIAWYFTLGLGTNGNRMTVAELKKALEISHVDTSRDWEYTFPNGRRVKVVVHGTATPITAGTIEKKEA